MANGERRALDWPSVVALVALFAMIGAMTWAIAWMVVSL